MSKYAFAATVLTALVGFPLLAQAQIQGLSVDTFVEQFDAARTQMDAAEAFIRQEQFADAVEILQRLIDASGDRIFTPAAMSPDRHVRVRSQCHKRISTLPAEGLAAYRRLVDSRANALMEQFRKSTDAALLDRIVDNFPNSTFGAEAMDLAAERAFCAGRWTQACLLWASLLPADFTDVWVLTGTLRTAADTRLVVQSPSTVTSKVAAKWLAGLILLGETKSAERGLAVYTKKFPESQGRLGGKSGRFVDLLVQLAGSDRKPSSTSEPRWLTFAGNSARGRNLAKPVEIGDVLHNWPLDDASAKSSRGSGASDDPPRGEEVPSFHPVVDGNDVIVLTERYLRTFHLDTGKAENWHDFLGEQNQNRGDGVNRQRFTLTLAGEKLFVRTGQESEQFRPHRWMVQMPSVESKLYCFDHRKQRMLWELNSKDVVNNNNYVFEGAPVVEGSNAYVAMTRIDAMAETSVACLDTASGKTKWRTVVCETSNEPGSRVSYNHNLLTLGEGSVFYCTNLGAIAALDSAGGKIRWLVTYPRGRRHVPGFTSGMSPDLNPCVYYRGRVFAAPTDNLKLLCLNAETGQKLWEAPWAMSHILGVGQGNLIVTGNRVGGIDIQTGKLKWSWPENTAIGYGRGLLAGDFVYWPTKTELHILEQSTGQKARATVPLSERFRLRGGNLAVAGQNLILAQTDRIVAMAPYARLIKRLQMELVKTPDSAPLHFQLAEAAATNEDFETASIHYRKALEFAKPNDKFEGELISEVSGPRLYRLLMSAADRNKRLQNPEKAEMFLIEAFAAAPVGDRLDAVRQIVAHFQNVNHPKSAAQWLQKVLDDPGLSGSRLVVEGSRVRISGSQWAAERLTSLTKYDESARIEAIESEAEKAVRSETDSDRLRRAASRFAWTRSGVELALKAAKSLEDKQQFRDARIAYDRLERIAEPSSNPRLQAILGQARCFDNAGYDVFESKLLERAVREFGKRSISGELTVEAFSHRRLEAIKANAKPPSAMEFRLDRSVEIVGDDRCVLPEGTAPVRGSRPYLRCSAKQIDWIDPASGNSIWQFAFGKTVRWACHSAGGLIVGSDDRIVCLGYPGGGLLWQMEIEADGATPTGFAANGNSVLVARRTRLLAVDLDDGVIQWEYLPAGGSLLPGIRLLDGLAVVAGSGLLLAIDPQSGKTIAELTRTDDTPQPPLALAGSKLIYAPDRTSLAAFDLKTGYPAWSNRLVMPSIEGPKLLAVGDDVFMVLDGYELCRLNAVDGKEVWRRRIAAKPRRFFNDALLVRGKTIFLGAEGWLEARSLETGDLLWGQVLPEKFFTQSMSNIGRGTVFFCNADSESLVGVIDPGSSRLAQLVRFSGTTMPDGFRMGEGRLMVARRGATTLLDIAGE